jgi:hypothetical protein
MLNGFSRNRIPIRIGDGTFEGVNSISSYHEQHPMPGAGIVLDDDKLNSAARGGYVVGGASNQGFAMTVRHVRFDEPQQLNSPPPPIDLVNQLIQSSGKDANGQCRVLQEEYEALMRQGEGEAEAKIKNNGSLVLLKSYECICYALS